MNLKQFTTQLTKDPEGWATLQVFCRGCEWHIESSYIPDLALREVELHLEYTCPKTQNFWKRLKTALSSRRQFEAELAQRSLLRQEVSCSCPDADKPAHELPLVAGDEPSSEDGQRESSTGEKGLDAFSEQPRGDGEVAEGER
jgi:hypothetical protein